MQFDIENDVAFFNYYYSLLLYKFEIVLFIKITYIQDL